MPNYFSRKSSLLHGVLLYLFLFVNIKKWQTILFTCLKFELFFCKRVEYYVKNLLRCLFRACFWPWSFWTSASKAEKTKIWIVLFFKKIIIIKITCIFTSKDMPLILLFLSSKIYFVLLSAVLENVLKKFKNSGWRW